MTTVLAPGKYRQRKDWSTNSIPTLVSLEEESDGHNFQPPKPPRRSSLAVGLSGGLTSGLAGGRHGPIGPDKHNKRRSSIAVAFLGRHNKNKDASYEVAVISEKSDSNREISPVPNRSSKWYEDNDNENDSGDGDGDGETEKSSTFDDNNASTPNDDDDISDKDKRRRSSWQAKVDRRRRKGMSSSQVVDDDKLDLSPPVGSGYLLHKRNSWWNIFVPDNLKQRSRRASTQDVGLTLNNENIVPRPFRSKSRSVDHGLAAPYDLESLRSKVEGRFDSVERLSRDGRHKGSMPTIPTKSYTVGNRDTLTSLAARFDTTPSELSGINKLNSSFIYPGQQLLVPDKSAVKDDADDGASTSGKSSPIDGKSRKTSSDEIPKEEKELLDGLRPGSPKPGHIERIASPNTNAPNEDDPVITQRFLKINVRHITDGQGVVGGVLLVTPNAVMFDPNVSDPLVIEHGPESYGVIAPMDLVVNAAIFHDIAHMRVGGEPHNTDKVEIYYPKVNRFETSHSPGKDSLLVKDETFPELGLGSVEGCDDQESVCSSNDREGDAFPKAFERDLVTPTNLQKVHATDSTDSTNSGVEKVVVADETANSSENASAALVKPLSTLEERRKSLLDHHWAVPSSKESRSLEDDTSIESSTITIATTASDISDPVIVTGSHPASVDVTTGNQLTKESCHDSGIDIRCPAKVSADSLPTVQPIAKKKNYSDADIVLSSEWVPPLTIAPTIFTETPPSVQAAQTNAQAQNVESGGRKKTSSVSFSVDDQEQQSGGSTSSDKTADNKKNKMLKRLSYPLSWVEGLTSDGKPATMVGSADTDSAPNTGDSGQSVFSKVFSSSPITLVSELGGNLFLSKTPSEDSGGSPVPHEGYANPGRSSIGTFIRPHSSDGNHPVKPNKAPPPKLDYRSMVSIDDMPELFVSFDKLIPRPARACPDPPLYLRLRMGRPIGKSMPLPTSVMSYGKNKLRPEFWFSIPKNRTDELFRFINTWVPHLYGELDEDQITARGFELIQHDTEWVKGGQSKDGRVNSDGEDITELTRESWELLKAPFVKTYNIIKSQTGSNDLEGCEVLSMNTDDYRKASLFATGSFDLDFPIPDLIGATEILTEEHREKICGHLPARAEGYSWSLIFSTSQHGFSLNSLYRKMQRLESPVLVVIQDTEHNVFGALTSCSLHVSDLFYGTGESLLYKFNPSFRVFHWTGENLYFIKGNPESLSIGAGDGKFGLWLDGDLNQGRSQRCSTYANELLAPQEDFVIKTLECWAFV